MRLGEFLVEPEIQAGRLIPILQDFNPGDAEEAHAVFVGGSNTPARVRAFVDFLAEQLRKRMQLRLHRLDHQVMRTFFVNVFCPPPR